MTTLERVIELKKKGIPESEIIAQLKNEEISPMEISDTMNQLKIKEAVSGEGETSTNGMVPSIMGNGGQETAPSQQEEVYTPSSAPAQDNQQDYGNYSAQEPQNYGGYSYGNGEDQEEYYDDDYSQDNYDGENYGMNSETMIEVAEQVFSEKMKKFESELKNLKEFKTIASPSLKDIDERLRRIEKQFDKMQIAILERVGEIGRNIDSVKKEVEMVEDSFEKMNKRVK